MDEIIIDLIKNESENTKLDFKLEQYTIEKANTKKGGFLRDMCAFANLSSSEDKFIILGVNALDPIHDTCIKEKSGPESNLIFT